MTKEYQPKKDNRHRLPHNLYMRTIYLIKDYERLKKEYEEILHSSPGPPDGMPRGNGTGDPTADKAMRMAAVFSECEAVEQAQLLIPEEYRSGVVNNVLYGIPYPDCANKNTWSKYRVEFIFKVAKIMKWI